MYTKNNINIYLYFTFTYISVNKYYRTLVVFAKFSMDAFKAFDETS